MRFEVTHVLDEIERHLTTDAALAQAVVDIGEVAWFGALDGGRVVNLLRVGLVIDALSRHLGEDAIMIYPVAGRALLTDADLTSKERMVLGRWASDGLIEVVPTIGDRVLEIGDITGLPVLTRSGYPGLEGRYPWLHGPERVLRLMPGEGGARLAGGVPGPARPAGPGAALLGRVWRCARRDCSTFGERRANTLPVPHMRSGVPVCPRHEQPLSNVGPRLPSLTMVLLVNGTVCERFVIRAGPPVMVGRAPDDPDGVVIGPFLSGDAAAMISRNHVRLDLREDVLLVTDVSTNGTVIHSRTSPFSGAADEIRLAGGLPYPLKPWDSIELHEGVALARADSSLIRRTGGPTSVMGDAPTVSIRPIGPRPPR
jgi:FHA domain